MSNTRKAGLGRGLGALLPAGTGQDAGPQEFKILELPIDRIRPNPHQPRKEFDQSELDELAASIRGVGLLQPVVVRTSADGDYEILVGERRLRAAKMAAMSTVPALVKDASEVEALEQALVENLQRSNLNPVEEGFAFRELLDTFELTQEEVARRMGKSRAHVANMVRILELPQSVRDLLTSKTLTAGHAKAILGLPNPEIQEAVATKVADEGLNVRQTEAVVRELVNSGGPVPGPQGTTGSGSKQRRPKFPDLEEKLADTFSTDVAVEVGRGRGRIVIHFGSRDDLERITQMLLPRRG